MVAHAGALHQRGGGEVTRLSHLGELPASDQQPRHYKLFSVLQTMTMFTLLIEGAARFAASF